MIQKLVYEQKNIQLLEKLNELRKKTWVSVIQTPDVHNIEIEIYDSNCPSCSKIISCELEACPHCNVKFTKAKIKNVKKHETPSKGRKECKGCRLYVGVRTFKCDCGYDFKTGIQEESTYSDQLRNPKKKKSVLVKIGNILDLHLLISNDILSNNIFLLIYGLSSC